MTEEIKKIKEKKNRPKEREKTKKIEFDKLNLDVEEL